MAHLFQDSKAKRKLGDKAPWSVGWRMKEVLSLRWEDVSLDRGEAVTRHADNKGGREELVPLHSVVVEHLRKIQDFDERVFPWPLSNRVLYSDFAAIQDAAGINLICREDHKHTDACHRYAFHDFRRAFARQNVEALSADALQRLMRHKAAATTKLYIDMSHKLRDSVEQLYVPDLDPPAVSEAEK